MKSKKGVEAFDQFYSEYFKERWPQLRKALLHQKEHLTLCHPDHCQADLSWKTHPLCPFLFFTTEYFKPKNSRKYYFMDPASSYAPLALKVQPGDQVLDLCAAPGGKSLIMGLQLKGLGQLVANDISAKRRARLKQVFKDFLPHELDKGTIKITGHDASKWCLYEKLAYDKILLDAPCSSERHLLEKPHLLEEWSPGRTKRLGKNQWTMLASAWQSLKYGGTLVYSTCSISPHENDEVIQKLYKKFGEEVELIPLTLRQGERFHEGTWILPDKSGWGPFYMACLKKRSPSN